MDNQSTAAQRSILSHGSGGTAVVLVCDKNYILPTMSTAISARRNISDPAVAVTVLVVDATDDWLGPVSERAKSVHVDIISAPMPEVATIARFHRDANLPPITLARLWLDRFLPPETDRFLYLDGDVMVDDELDTLLEIAPPTDRLMVALDNKAMFAGEGGRNGREHDSYFHALEITRQQYFNCGVIYARRNVWSRMAPAAIDFLTSHPELCGEADQSALNRVSGGRSVVLSQRYNYQSEHMMVMDPRSSRRKINIYHFTGGPKPWAQVSWPWDEYFNRYYKDAEILFEGLGIETPVSPVQQIRSGVAHRRRFRFRQSFLYPWRQTARRKQLEKLLLHDHLASHGRSHF
jgi:lipopolysaccharide biosynthesis glycosyltransferase